ncbi:MAG: selenide, water dikinase SelD [Prochlorothrix sp.]|nr:selenide, water dikinase SelD [Prochlorothrix sp.]
MEARELGSLGPNQTVVLVGGGHSHALVLKLWGMNPLPGVHLILITDQTHTPYSGMLPGHVAGFYDFDTCHIDLRRLAQFAGAQFYLDRVTGLDLSQQRVLCGDHPPVTFDWLSLDIGSTPNVGAVPGAAAWAIPAKPVPQFLQQWQQILTEVEAEPDRSRQWAIVGGGAGGVELALSLRSRMDRLYDRLGPDRQTLGDSQSRPTLPIQFHLIHRGKAPMKGHSPRIQALFRQHLQTLGIRLHSGETVTEVLCQPRDPSQPRDLSPNARYLQLEHQSGLQLSCDRLFWVTDASAPPWLREAGLQTDDRGFVVVGQTLQSLSHPQVLATGDIATIQHHPRPKAGVFAVRQGQPLFDNLRALCQGRSPRPYRPQRQILALIGDGQGRAAASRGVWSLPFSSLLWRWKDRIDRRFMAQFAQLPPIAAMAASAPRLPISAAPSVISAGDATAPRPDAASPGCAGCGAKVGAASLDRVLARLRRDYPPRSTASVLVGLDTPDDAAVLQPPSTGVLVQTVDFFRALVSDPFVFGQITANHCLNDLFAMGATPHSALAIVTLPPGSPGIQEETLYQLLAGMLKVLDPLGVDLVGGHTTTGSDLAFGLTCNGWGQPDQLWSKGGMEPGQAVILTKPLGTGSLFAGAMLGQTRGRWLDGAIANMCQSNGAAVEIFRHHGATACTDITGFGLVGHGVEMMRASRLGIQLEAAAIPRLPGVEVLWAQHIVSSLHPANAQALSWLDPRSQPLTPVLEGLLCDPQTSGGLLATVPVDRALACVQALRDAGYLHSNQIGVTGPQVGDDPTLLLA